MAEQLTPEQMDNAASAAEEELQELLKRGAEFVVSVAVWWRKWYLLAGHKRLGRIIMQKSVKSSQIDWKE